MTEHYSEDQALAAVARLTRDRLRAFVEAELVAPLPGETGIAFRRVDLARIELLCELSEDFDLPPDGLGIVMSLIDQLHAVRADLLSLVEAVQAQPKEVREGIEAVCRSPRKGP